jgi:hypothetical protein
MCAPSRSHTDFTILPWARKARKRRVVTGHDGDGDSKDETNSDTVAVGIKGHKVAPQGLSAWLLRMCVW